MTRSQCLEDKWEHQCKPLFTQIEVKYPEI
jgi:hypothetical protein